VLGRLASRPYKLCHFNVKTVLNHEKMAIAGIPARRICGTGWKAGATNIINEAGAPGAP